MQTVIIAIVVGLAVFFIARNYYRKYKAVETSESCGCACDSCGKDRGDCEEDNPNRIIDMR